MLNYDVQELIFNHLKDDNNKNKQVDIKNWSYYTERYDKIKNMTDMTKYFKQEIYRDNDVMEILEQNVKYSKKDNEFQIKSGTNKKIYNHFNNKIVKFIEDMVDVDYKKLIFNNELRTNKLELVKKYTDADFKKNIKIIINEDIEYYKKSILESCRMCDKCNHIINDEHDYLLYINDKYICRYCWKYIEIQNNTLIASYDELINYNCFNWNDDNQDIENIKHKLLKNEIAYAIHKHNIKLMIDNDKKYTKRDLRYEMICFDLYSEDDINDDYTDYRS